MNEAVTSAFATSEIATPFATSPSAAIPA